MVVNIPYLHLCSRRRRGLVAMALFAAALAFAGFVFSQDIAYLFAPILGENAPHENQPDHPVR